MCSNFNLWVIFMHRLLTVINLWFSKLILSDSDYFEFNLKSLFTDKDQSQSATLGMGAMNVAMTFVSLALIGRKSDPANCLYPSYLRQKRPDGKFWWSRVSLWWSAWQSFYLQASLLLWVGMERNWNEWKRKWRWSWHDRQEENNDFVPNIFCSHGLKW